MMGKKIMLLKLCGKYWFVRGKVKTAELVTAQKVSIFGAIMVRILRIQSECGRMRTRITPNTDTFHAVHVYVKWWAMHKNILSPRIKCLLSVSNH